MEDESDADLDSPLTVLKLLFRSWPRGLHWSPVAEQRLLGCD